MEREMATPQTLTYIIDPDFSQVIPLEINDALQAHCIQHSDISFSPEESMLTIRFLATCDETETVKKYINYKYDFVGD